jgi:hypothetical protein
MNQIHFTVSQSVSMQRLHDLLITAFEGGSNYWMTDLHLAKLPDGMKKSDFEFWHGEVPLREGGVLKFADAVEADPKFADESGHYSLDLEKVSQGLHTFASKFPRHYGNFMRENDDAETADVFLQCCVFGDVIYG